MKPGRPIPSACLINSKNYRRINDIFKSTRLCGTLSHGEWYLCYQGSTKRNNQTTGEKAACLHDAPFAFDHEDNLDGQSDKQRNTRTDRAAVYGRSSDQKESPMDWTLHEDVNRQATKAYYLLPTSSDHRKRGRRLMDIILTAER